MPAFQTSSVAASSAPGILQDLSKLGDASPRDLTNQQAGILQEYLEGDLFWFAWFVFGFHDLRPELHGKIAELVGRWGQPGYERLMVQIPREYFKTSLCTIANPLWQICREPELPIAIFNEKQDNAAMWVRMIRDVTQSNLLFQALWPHLMPPGKAGPDDSRSTPRWWKWNDDEIMFQRDRVQPEASISALGIGSASAGRHWPKIIMDDLVSEDAERSSAVMATAKEWVDKAVYLERPALKGQVLVACTPWTYDDVYAHMLRKYPFKLYRRSSLEDADGQENILGESTFPEKLTKEELLEHLERDDFGFMAQMQCTPRPGRDRSFDPKLIRWGEISGGERQMFRIRTEDYDSTIVGDVGLAERPPPVVPLGIMAKAVLLDPAPTEESEIRREKGARNGIVVPAKDPWGRRFVLDCWASRADPLEVIDQLFQMMDRWETDTVGIEEVNFSKLYRWWLLQEAQRRGRMVRVLQLKTGNRDKDTRIRSRIPGFRKGLYYFNRETTGPLVKELAEFPHGGTRDLLDALAYDDCVVRPETLAEHEQQVLADRILEVGMNEVTGY